MDGWIKRRRLTDSVQSTSPTPKSQTISARTSSIAEALFGVLWVLSYFICLILYSHIGRPIWIDEFLHFAFAGFSSPPEAIDAIQKSVLTFNFNQTGIYMFTDFCLLKIFGASALALRLPSILSSAWLIWNAVWLFSIRNYSNFWKLMLVLAIAVTGSLMDYAAEARPYMPLASATIGTLTYYTARVRTRTVRIAGFLSITLGALMHPYYPLYWFFVAVVGAALAIVEGRLATRTKPLIDFIDPVFLIFGMGLYLLVGAMSWMQGGPSLTFDPFQFIPKDRILATMIDFTHFEMIYARGGVFQLDPAPQRLLLIAVALFLILIPFVRKSIKIPLTPMVPPAMVIVGSILISASLSLLSYRHNYWILGRQWVASLALMPVALVWLSAEIGRLLERFVRGGSIAIALPLLYVIVGSLINVLPSKLNAFEADLQMALHPVPSIGPASPTPTNNDQWVALANANIAQGGDVWPVFSKFYR